MDPITHVKGNFPDKYSHKNLFHMAPRKREEYFTFMDGRLATISNQGQKILRAKSTYWTLRLN